MQSLRRSAFSLGSLNKHTTRSVSVNSVEAKLSDDLKSWRDIPGPSSLPIIGQLHHFLPGGSLSDRNDFTTDKLYKRYGPIVRFDGKFGSPPMIILYDAEAVSQILRGENWLPIRPGLHALKYYRTKILRKDSDPPDAPTGLITDSGEVWKKLRSTVNPVVLQPNTIKLYREILKQVSEDMIRRMRLIRNDKNMIEGDFNYEMNLWALESLGVVALGQRLNCFDQNLPDASPTKKLINLVHDVFVFTEKVDFKPSIWRYIATPAFKQAMKCYDEQMKTSKYFITKSIEELKTKKKASDKEKGVLEKLLEIDENVAIITATDMIFAGVDTTATTVTSVLYLLAQHPDKQNKLREEILSKEEKQSYVKACVKESLRLMPVVAGNMRLTSKEYNIFGYKIPKEMHVIFGHQALSVMEQHYPRPKEFIPERWLVDKNDPLYHGNAHPFAYSPFGFGVRTCLGRRIADLEIETFVSKVIENFQIEWFGPAPKTRVSTINYITGPFNFIFKDI